MAQLGSTHSSSEPVSMTTVVPWPGLPRSTKSKLLDWYQYDRRIHTVDGVTVDDIVQRIRTLSFPHVVELFEFDR